MNHNHHNSAVLRLQRAPPSMCPSPNRPRYQTCVWMDPLCMNVWTQCWGARFISSNETSPTGHHPLPPGGWGQESGCACRICAREWTDELSVLGCVRDWEYARLGENACKRWGKKIQIQHLERNKNWETQHFEVSKGFRKEILPLNERLILKSLKGRTLDKKKIIVITRIIFLFWIIVKLVLIDTGQCYGRYGAAVHCIKMHLVAFGLFCLPPVCSFLWYLLFSAFSFIASVKVNDDDRIPPSCRTLTYAPDMGLMLWNIDIITIINQMTSCPPCDTSLFFLQFTAKSLLCSIVAIREKRTMAISRRIVNHNLCMY